MGIQTRDGRRDYRENTEPAATCYTTNQMFNFSFIATSPMTPSVRLSVGLVGRLGRRSIIFSYMRGKLNFHAPIGALVYNIAAVKHHSLIR